MGQRDAFRRFDHNDEPVSLSGLLLKCYVVVAALGATLGGAIGVSRLFANRYPTMDGFGCAPGTSPQFSANAYTLFNDMYSDTTRCPEPYDFFIKARGEQPELLNSFSSYVELRNSFDKKKGRQVVRTSTFNRPGEGLPSVAIFSPVILGPDAKEIPYDPGYGDETHILGELRGKINDYCMMKLRRHHCK